MKRNTMKMSGSNLRVCSITSTSGEGRLAVRVTLAHNTSADRAQNRPTFIKCLAFNRTGEWVQEHLKAGDAVSVFDLEVVSRRVDYFTNVDGQPGRPISVNENSFVIPFPANVRIEADLGRETEEAQAVTALQMDTDLEVPCQVAMIEPAFATIGEAVAKKKGRQNKK